MICQMSRRFGHAPRVARWADCVTLAGAGDQEVLPTVIAALFEAHRIRLGIDHAAVDFVETIVATITAHHDAAEVELGAIRGFR